jgi:hypothetical protein
MIINTERMNSGEIEKMIRRATVKVEDNKVKFLSTLSGHCVFVINNSVTHVVTHDAIYMLKRNPNGGFTDEKSVHHRTLMAFCESIGVIMYEVKRETLKIVRGLEFDLGSLNAYRSPGGYIVGGYGGESESFTYTGTTYIDTHGRVCPEFSTIKDLNQYARDYRTLY